MDFDSCFQLGYVIKAHGLKGEVSVLLETDQPQAYQKLESVFVEQQQRLIPFFINHLRIQGDKAVIKLDGIDHVDSAVELKNHKLWLPLEFLPELSGTAFYFHEIIGFNVRDQLSGELGLVTSVYDSASQNLIAVDHHGQEVLIPIADDIILKVNRKEKVIETKLPDGLLDIYTAEDEN